MSDLTDHLRELRGHDDFAAVEEALRKAAARIDALEAELLHEQGQVRGLRVMNVALDRASSARAAVIAEARKWQQGVLAEPSEDSPTVTYAEWIRKAVGHLGTILSRVPQGAAEPFKDSEAYLGRDTIAAEPWTDPIYARCSYGESIHVGGMFGHEYVPRSREQYDAEEGAK